MSAVPATPLVYEFSRHLPARVRIEPGTALKVESEDALSGQIRKASDRRDKRVTPWSNPVTGPIVVDGARPGDALAVQILGIEPLIGQCATYNGGPRLLAEWLGTDFPHGTRVCPIRDGLIEWDERTKLPYAPMLGCIGTAPDWGSPTTGPAGAYGGNLDLVEVCPCNTVLLPVFVEGGYLYLGDAHASQGHGELSATALEMPARTTIRVDLVQSARLPGPRIESPDELMAVAASGALERSIAEASAKLMLWLESDFGMSRWDAYDLFTQAGRLSIGHYINGAVAAKIEKRYVGPVKKPASR